MATIAEHLGRPPGSKVWVVEFPGKQYMNWDSKLSDDITDAFFYYSGEDAMEEAKLNHGTKAVEVTDEEWPEAARWPNY